MVGGVRRVVGREVLEVMWKSLSYWWLSLVRYGLKIDENFRMKMNIALQCPAASLSCFTHVNVKW